MARWIGMEIVTWLIAGCVLVLVIALVAPPVAAVAVGAGVTLVLAMGSWARRSREGMMRRRGLSAADDMTGEEFEDWLAALFRSAGWHVRHTRVTGDFGADLILRRDDAEFVVQAKRQARPVGVAAVQQVAAARLHYGVERAMVVTNATFTAAACALASTNDVALWDRDDISRELLAAPRRRAADMVG
jgi:restriction system protein